MQTNDVKYASTNRYSQWGVVNIIKLRTTEEQFKTRYYCSAKVQ